MGANLNPDLQIQYSVQLFIKLYSQLEKIKKINGAELWNYFQYLDFIYELCQYLDLDLDLQVVDLCPSLAGTIATVPWTARVNTIIAIYCIPGYYCKGTKCSESLDSIQSPPKKYTLASNASTQNLGWPVGSVPHPLLRFHLSPASVLRQKYTFFQGETVCPPSQPRCIQRRYLILGGIFAHSFIALNGFPMQNRALETSEKNKYLFIPHFSWLLSGAFFTLAILDLLLRDLYGPFLMIECNLLETCHTKFTIISQTLITHNLDNEFLV